MAGSGDAPDSGDVAHWETRERETLLEAPIFRVDRVRRRHPDGTEGDFYSMDVPDWSNVVAVTPDERVVLVRQYRHGTDELTVEIPGGNIDEGESPVEAGRRELIEETGYDADGFKQIGVVDPNPAFMNNRCYTILAKGAERVREPEPDLHEEFEIETVPRGDLYRLVEDGTIRHAMVVAAAFHLRAREDRG